MFNEDICALLYGCDEVKGQCFTRQQKEVDLSCPDRSVNFDHDPLVRHVQRLELFSKVIRVVRILERNVASEILTDGV